MAESKGFEPLRQVLPAYTISNRAPSATRTALHMAPQVGLEPTTDRLTAECSTTELLRNNIVKLGNVLLSQGETPNYHRR